VWKGLLTFDLAIELYTRLVLISISKSVPLSLSLHNLSIVCTHKTNSTSMAEVKKENVRIIDFLASSIHRKNRSGVFVEKGGGKDGSFATSKVELRIPKKSFPFVTVYYGTKPTVVAAVNSVEARCHNDNEETVFILLKNHVGWTKGMTRLHRFTFVDEIDAAIFVDNYNLLANTVGQKGREDAEEALVALLENTNLEEEQAETTRREASASVEQNEDCAEKAVAEEGTEESSEESSGDEGDEDSILDEQNLEEQSFFDEDEDDSFGPMTQEDYPDGEFTSSY
jgi:hypothetical protein